MELTKLVPDMDGLRNEVSEGERLIQEGQRASKTAGDELVHNASMTSAVGGAASAMPATPSGWH